MSIIQQMRDATQLKTLNAKGRMVSTDPWLERLAIRKFSIHVTWLFVKLGLSANAATTLMLICGFLGFVLCIPHNLALNLLGLGMLLFFRVLDCVDGEIARWTKKSSVRGLYLDLCSHVFCNPGLPMIAAAHYFFWKGQDNTFLYIALIVYLAGQWREGVRLADSVARKEIMSDAEKRKAQEAKAVAGEAPSTGKRAVQLAEIIIKAPNDMFVMLVANVGAVLASYWGHEAPLKAVAWFYLFYGPPMVPLITAAKYFRMPEVKHEKGHAIDVH